jgi:nanoRNase/pAp phosphatase (c-di-AMP/oligoRNAs hydrolase)
MKNYVVTSGEAFTDIDAFACAIAYGELLKLEGSNVEVVLPGPLNHSITPTIRSWNFEFKTEPSFSEYSSQKSFII